MGKLCRLPIILSTKYILPQIPHIFHYFKSTYKSTSNTNSLRFTFPGKVTLNVRIDCRTYRFLLFNLFSISKHCVFVQFDEDEKEYVKLHAVFLIHLLFKSIRSALTQNIHHLHQLFLIQIQPYLPNRHHIQSVCYEYT